MSTDNNDNGDGDVDGFNDYDSHRVIDEEGSVDAKVKERILNSREAINENENILFTQRAIMPDINISRPQAIVAWGHSVRRYVRDVEILLSDDEIPESERYYEEIELGEVTLTPPDKSGYQFSLFSNPDLDNKQLKKRMALPHDCDVPEPVTRTFNGLRSIIESEDVISHEWQFFVDKTGPQSGWEIMTLEAQQPIPKDIYELAVRHTDQFLQKAGIGIETGTPEVYDESEPW